MTRQSS